MNNEVNNNFDNNYQQQPTYSAPVNPQYNMNTNPSKKIPLVPIAIVMVTVIVAVVVIIFMMKNGDKNSGSGSITYIAPNSTDTHKGIVYLDPTNLSNKCTEKEVNANVNENGTPTEIKTGCMRFYIFDDSEDTYKMILDHNTTALIAYGNISHTDVYTDIKSDIVMAALKEDTKGWVGNPRLITADEVAHIVGVDNILKWESSKVFAEKDTDGNLNISADNQISSFDFDGNGNDYSGWQRDWLTTKEKTKYTWLYNNTSCMNNGCITADIGSYDNYDNTRTNGIMGYWTSTPVNNFDGSEYFSTPYAWVVGSGGDLGISLIISDYFYGVRPVIELSKETIEGEKMSENEQSETGEHTKFEATVYVKTEKEGGRKTAFFDNYIPSIHFDSGKVVEARIEFIGKSEVASPGDTENLIINLSSPASIKVGTKFTFNEGEKIIATGSVTKIIE